MTLRVVSAFRVITMMKSTQADEIIDMQTFSLLSELQAKYLKRKLAT